MFLVSVFLKLTVTSQFNTSIKYRAKHWYGFCTVFNVAFSLLSYEDFQPVSIFNDSLNAKTGRPDIIFAALSFSPLTFQFQPTRNHPTRQKHILMLSNNR